MTEFPCVVVHDGQVISRHFNPAPVVGPNGVQHPRTIFDLWTKEEWAAEDMECIPVRPVPAPSSDTHEVGDCKLIYENGCARMVWDATQRPLNDVRKRKLKALKDKRDTVRSAGIMVGGIQLSTDRDSCGDITGKALALQLRPDATGVRWKADNGWVSITRDDFIAAALAVEAFVQACFDQEANHAAAIAELVTLEELIAYDITTGWPETPAPEENAP